MNKPNLMTSIPKLREASMVQNTTQDAPEEIIDLTEIIQKGKIPPGGAKKGIDFDSALSDLQGTAKNNSLNSTPGLDDLLAGLDDPLIAPFDKAVEPGEGNAVSQKDTFDEFAEPAQPEVPSFDSLFADLGLASPPDRPSVPDAPILDAPDLPNLSGMTDAAAPSLSSGAEAPDTSTPSPFSETIPGLDDVDALISKLDIPPSGGKKPDDNLQNFLDEQAPAPADLDSLLDSLLSAGGGKVQPKKVAKGQPKEISEEDLDDLLNSIEVESSGIAPAPAVADEAGETPVSFPSVVTPEAPVPPVTEDAPPVDLYPEKTEHDAELPVDETPDGESSDGLGEENIEALFDALDTVSAVDNAQAEARGQEPDLDALVNFDELDTLLSTRSTDEGAEKDALPGSDLSGSGLSDSDPLAAVAVPAQAVQPAQPSQVPPATPSLSDVLSGKALATDQDENTDALFAGFDEQNEAIVDSAEGVEPLDPVAILAGVDELSHVAPAEELPLPEIVTPVSDELLERIGVLEAELTLLQSRVDALESTAAGEDLQSHLMDLLVDGNPFYARCVEIAQSIVEANALTAQTNQAGTRSLREAELEQRLLAVEERQNDLDWGRQQGVSELENRFSEFENRFDVDSRLEPLEKRLAALEKKQRATDIEKRLAALEQAVVNAPAPAEPVVPERMAEQMIELLRADIDKAAAESAARVLREEIAALISEH